MTARPREAGDRARARGRRRLARPVCGAALGAGLLAVALIGSAAPDGEAADVRTPVAVAATDGTMRATLRDVDSVTLPSGLSFAAEVAHETPPSLEASAHYLAILTAAGRGMRLDEAAARKAVAQDVSAYGRSPEAEVGIAQWGAQVGQMAHLRANPAGLGCAALIPYVSRGPAAQSAYGLGFVDRVCWSAQPSVRTSIIAAVRSLPRPAGLYDWYAQRAVTRGLGMPCPRPMPAFTVPTSLDATSALDAFAATQLDRDGVRPLSARQRQQLVSVLRRRLARPIGAETLAAEYGARTWRALGQPRSALDRWVHESLAHRTHGGVFTGPLVMDGSVEDTYWAARIRALAPALGRHSSTPYLVEGDAQPGPAAEAFYLRKVAAMRTRPIVAAPRPEPVVTAPEDIAALLDAGVIGRSEAVTAAQQQRPSSILAAYDLSILDARRIDADPTWTGEVRAAARSRIGAWRDRAPLLMLWIDVLAAGADRLDARLRHVAESRLAASRGCPLHPALFTIGTAGTAKACDLPTTYFALRVQSQLQGRTS